MLKITKQPTSETKQTFLNELAENHPIFAKELKSININDFQNPYEIINAIERNILLKQQVYPQPYSEKAYNIASSHPYITVILGGLLVCGIIYAYLHKDTVYNYITHLGETTLGIIKKQYQLGIINAYMLENDRKIALILGQIKHEIESLKMSQLSPEMISLIKDHLQKMPAIMSRVGNLEIKMHDNVTILTTELNETGIMLGQVPAY